MSLHSMNQDLPRCFFCAILRIQGVIGGLILMMFGGYLDLFLDVFSILFEGILSVIWMFLEVIIFDH